MQRQGCRKGGYPMNSTDNNTSRLYGDGIHDDTEAIQALLDSGACDVTLPAPTVCYLISRTIKIHSNQSLRLPPFAHIRLADGADCAMLENSDFSTLHVNVSVEGGIWDMNNAGQSPNPYHFPDKSGVTARDRMASLGLTFENMTAPAPIYTGMCMRFSNVRNLTLRGITLRNPVTYGVQIYKTRDFTVCDVTFD